MAVSGTVTTSSGLTPMHFEVLVEDPSGGIAIDRILEKILGANYTNHTWKLITYRGIGRIPKDLRSAADPQKRLLLDKLPKLLRGYGKSLPDGSVVVVVVDLDRRDCMSFKQELLDVLHACNPPSKDTFQNSH